MFGFLESSDWCCIGRAGRCDGAGVGVIVVGALAGSVIGFGGELDFAFSFREEFMISSE